MTTNSIIHVKEYQGMSNPNNYPSAPPPAPPPYDSQPIQTGAPPAPGFNMNNQQPYPPPLPQGINKYQGMPPVYQPQQPGYPPPMYPPQQGYPPQPVPGGYAPYGYQQAMPGAYVYQQPNPNYGVAGPPGSSVVYVDEHHHHRNHRTESDDLKDCCLCALCLALCCFCCSD